MKPDGVLKKLKLLTFLPLAVIALGFFYFALESVQALSRTESLKEKVRNIQHAALFINELQRERGLASGFLASDGKKFADELIRQRRKVDGVLKNLLTFSCRDGAVVERIARQIGGVRKKIDRKSVNTAVAFETYSKMIGELIAAFLRMKTGVEESYAKNLLDTYSNLVFMKESTGRVRGAINGLFVRAAKDRSLLVEVLRARGVFDNALFRFRATAPDKEKKALEALLQTPEYRWFENRVRDYLDDEEGARPPIDASVWWEKATRLTDALFSIEKLFFADLDTFIENRCETIRTKIAVNFAWLMLFALFIAWLSYRIRENVLRNIRLLDEYKEAVDRGTIVSKTDRRGIITYTNDRFCQISGYRREELLGKPHNIVRHPDMPAETFRNMWKTIRSKKTWHGIIKNRSKDGGEYVVEATVKPILDHNGNIEEYIAIRHDITQVYRLKEELETTQRDLLFKMGEMSEARSAETGFHVQRVAEYSKLLGVYAGIEGSELESLYLASSMHDIGKIAIPDGILHKCGSLSPKEWETMKRHTLIGYDIFKNSDKPLFKAAAVIALEHHENYDGSGYPYGKRGEEIHIFGRIVALADVFDALATKRCYKEAWPMEKVLAFIKKESGGKFDPDLVEILFEHLEEFLQIRKKLTAPADRN